MVTHGRPSTDHSQRTGQQREKEDGQKGGGARAVFVVVERLQAPGAESNCKRRARPPGPREKKPHQEGDEAVAGHHEKDFPVPRRDTRGFAGQFLTERGVSKELIETKEESAHLFQAAEHDDAPEDVQEADHGRHER